MQGHARTAVITGASAGIGRAVASAFARRGWNVALVARDPIGLDEASKDVELAGGTPLAAGADVADAAATFAAAGRVAEGFGPIDDRVNKSIVTIVPTI